MSSLEYSSNVLKPSKLKRDNFLDSYFPWQNWSLPDSVIYYITKNPSTPEAYQKLIQCCKYFFIKNPIIVIPNILLEYDEWKIYFNESNLIAENKIINIEKIGSKFWIIEKFGSRIVTHQNTVSSIIPKMYNPKFSILHLSNQILSFNEFNFLASNATEINLEKITIKYGNGKTVEFEKVVECCCLNAESFLFDFNETITNISPKTVKELAKLLPTSKLKYFALIDLTEAFGIKTFFNEFSKKNKIISTDLAFSDSLSDEYIDMLEDVLCEIVETETFEYSPPFINLPGLGAEVQDALFDIAYQNYFG